MRKTLTARLVRTEQITANNWQSSKAVGASMNFPPRHYGYVSRDGVFWSHNQRHAAWVDLCLPEEDRSIRRSRAVAARQLRDLDTRKGRALP